MRTEEKKSDRLRREKFEIKQQANRFSKFNFYSHIVNDDNFFILKSSHHLFYAFNLVTKPALGPMYLQIFLDSSACEKLLYAMSLRGYKVIREVNSAINSADVTCICIEGPAQIKIFVASLLCNPENIITLAPLDRLYEQYLKDVVVQPAISSNRYALATAYTSQSSSQLRHPAQHSSQTMAL